ncbi:unnamed protein product [Rotaria sp. Silwood1]|nr:unnamed protein product [Rotaria sp. Silwood1]CAF1640381.1 unnamed protein product [Rotaria sp. Silwood1]CAF3833661.1 unnamed protein product [Rotaria sp. Silwood1]CAF5025153.1 unnamed protein product [Rotaria sp. Silwood1]CAF5048768.1 unnamed protein product [Rotaria sp. Silwood1]
MVFENTQQGIPLPMKIGVAIEHDEEYHTIDTIHKICVSSQSRLQSNSIVAMNSSSSSKIVDMPKNSEYQSSRLTIVEDVEKYSIIQRKSKDRKIATLTQRSIPQLKREYGNVYI